MARFEKSAQDLAYCSYRSGEWNDQIASFRAGYSYPSGSSGVSRKFRLTATCSPIGSHRVVGVSYQPTRSGEGQIVFQLALPSQVEVRITNLAGRVIRCLKPGKAYGSAWLASLGMAGINRAESPMGTYLCQVLATTEEGQRHKGWELSRKNRSDDSCQSLVINHDKTVMFFESVLCMQNRDRRYNQLTHQQQDASRSLSEGRSVCYLGMILSS